MDGLCRFGGAVSLAHKPQTSVQEDLSAQQLRSHLHDTGQGPGGWRPERTVKTVKLEGVTLTRSMLASSQIPTLASKLPLLCHFHWRCEVSIVSHSQVLVGFQCTNSTQDFPTRLSLNALYTYTLKISSVKYRSMPFWSCSKVSLEGFIPDPLPYSDMVGLSRRGRCPRPMWRSAEKPGAGDGPREPHCGQGAAGPLGQHRDALLRRGSLRPERLREARRQNRHLESWVEPVKARSALRGEVGVEEGWEQAKGEDRGTIGGGLR